MSSYHLPSKSLRDYSSQREKFIILFRRSIFDWLQHIKQFQIAENEERKQHELDAIDNYSKFRSNKLNKMRKQNNRKLKYLPIDRLNYAQTLKCRDIVSLLDRDQSILKESNMIKLPECNDNSESMLYSDINVLSKNIENIQKKRFETKDNQFYGIMTTFLHDLESILEYSLSQDRSTDQVSPWEAVLSMGKQKKSIPGKTRRKTNEYRQVEDKVSSLTEQINRIPPVDRSSNISESKTISDHENYSAEKSLSKSEKKQRHKTKHFGSPKIRKEQAVLSFVDQLRNVAE
eukprot:gb/GECH01011395.1/.p1 GENE.gb/GECH01011395.1/~~gb/GECH01011395.1/.p1  ORF type:complete len:289 (+),score=79.65 gb/GECH01011395.1/:1-867(+)